MGKRHDTMADEWIAQAGAVPYRLRGDGEVQVLLVKSRSGLWILPKGHIEEGHTPEETAQREAFEEAGVQGQVVPGVIGSYHYEKTGSEYRVELFVLRVSRTLDEWPERDQRERLWLSLDEARRKVAYPELRQALDRLERMLDQA